MRGKKQFAAIDIARYISALLVVCIHVYPFVGISETFNTYFIQTVCRLAVPFYFTVSGYFFFRKWSKDESENEHHFRHYIVRIGKLYLIWSVIYLPYTIWNYASAGFSFMDIFSYIRDFFMTGSYYHLWFLPSLIVGMFIVYECYRRKGLSFTLKISLILYLIGYVINVYAPIWENTPYVSILYGFFTKTIVTARNGLFFGPIYLALGLLLARTRRLKVKASLSAFLISFILLCLEVTLYIRLGIMYDLSSMFLMLVPATYFLVNALLAVRIPYRKQYTIMRYDSLLIYTSHILFVKVLFLVMPNANLVVYFATLALSQLFASIIVRAKETYPIFNNLI